MGIIHLNCQRVFIPLEPGYVGYQTKTVEINLNSNQSINFDLKEESTNLEEVVVSARRKDENVSSVKMEH